MNRRDLIKTLGAGGATLAMSGCLEGGRGMAPAGLSPRGAAAGAPRGLHVSLGNDAASTRSVTWFHDGTEPPAGAMLEFDAVLPGMDAAQIQSTPMNLRAPAQADPTPGVEAWTLRATAENIDPERPLRYRVGSQATGWSPVQVVAPTPSGDFRFTHFGDHGISACAQALSRQVLADDSDLLLLAGDLSYANGDQPIWDTWFAQNEPLFAQRVMMAAPGNHEEEDDAGRTFKNRFTHPNPMSSQIFGGNPGSTFYSFDYNRVHFLVTTAGALINDATLPEEILAIETDLALAAARRAAGQLDFIVVMQHFTIWTDQIGRSPANPSLVALEENILLRYGVDLLLVGHDHVYQRSVPMGLGLANPLGYVQMMVGTGGASIRLFDEDGPQSWSARQFIGVGYARYRVEGRVIRGEYLGAPPVDLSDEGRQSLGGDFRVVDSFEFRARGPELARQFARPPRGPETLLANFEAIERHTRERNHHARHHC